MQINYNHGLKNFVICIINCKKKNYVCLLSSKVFKIIDNICPLSQWINNVIITLELISEFLNSIKNEVKTINL